MGAPPTPCVCGCTIRGQHDTHCPERCRHLAPARPRLPQECPERCDHDCPGCAPRPAKFGRLCPWDWQRLHADIVDSPALVRYLWALAHCGETTSPDNLNIRGGDPSERGVLHTALDALNGLHACLASWAHHILEEHPNGSQMAGPDQHGVWSTTTEPPETVGIRDPEATSQLVRWLLPQLRWCADQEWVGEMRREIGDVVRTTAARFPVTERTRTIPGVECTVCHRVSLAYDPPTLERRTVQVNCTSPGCGVIFTEAEFARLTKIIEWEHNQTKVLV